MPEQGVSQKPKDTLQNDDKPMRGLLAEAPLRAILVSIDTVETDWPIEESLDELEQLATTAGVACVDRLVQKMDHPHPGTLLGSGKVEELKSLLEYNDCDAVIFDLELKPSQHRNLERTLDIQVLDRTALILIIFGQRARTREGRLQVELAQVEYDLPRLTRQWSHLSRQSGGGTNQRGEGEKQIEVDRRMLRRQKDKLSQELDLVRSQRQLHRERRKSTGAPVIALVGYTNAGKSTLLNRLSSANTLAENKLFATLDPTTRRVRIQGGQEILLSDTVGFVQRLPTTLVAAFRATLEEVAAADLLVHVADASHPHVLHQIQAVESVLEEIGAGGLPVVLALNKMDLVEDQKTLELTGISATFPQVSVSAATGEGIEQLLRCISETLVQQFTELDVVIPYSHGELVAQFHQYGTIESEEYEDWGTHIRGYVPKNHSGPFMPFKAPKFKHPRVLALSEIMGHD
ncbi:MAG TPA: GTPase HflX [Dictyobacter sp.]|nr:GTPase HflX [Dictyobacter sp.]